MQPLIVAYHLIWTAYGWWLPNDPRGSMNRVVAFDPIADLGDLHFGRKRLQPASADIRAFYDRAKDALTHDLLTFDDDTIISLAHAFTEVIHDQRYTCYGCALMPDHVHVLIRKHKHQAEDMIQNFQHASRSRLRTERRRPLGHTVWDGPGWKVFLDHPDDIRRTVRYIEENPIKARQPAQSWNFVTKYDGWPLHERHNPNSPYAKRLRRS